MMDVKTGGMGGLAVVTKLLVLGLTVAWLFPGETHQPGSGPMVFIPAGSFVMGSDLGLASSRPAHRVMLSAYWIDRYEVTFSRYQSYVADSGLEPLAWRTGTPDLPPGYPVTGILWKEAQAYCEFYGLRLPTEAEWERAARGEDERLFPWGDHWLSGHANTLEAGWASPIEVGSYPQGASPYGLHDLCGNAQEWVLDRFDPGYYASSPVRDPTGSQLVLDHVLRGGSFESQQAWSTAIFRDSSHSVRPNPRVGFRCVYAPPQG